MAEEHRHRLQQVARVEQPHHPLHCTGQTGMHGVCPQLVTCCSHRVQFKNALYISKAMNGYGLSVLGHACEMFPVSTIELSCEHFHSSKIQIKND